MRPHELLAHADRLLTCRPDEADRRRAVSAFYYALFHLLTGEAADHLVRHGPAAAHTAVRRSFEHRGLRRVCEGLLSQGKARPKLLDDIMPASLPLPLTMVAAAFVGLQDYRMIADYDLDAVLPMTEALACQTLAQQAFTNWRMIQGYPATDAFLIAIHLSDRLSRRG